MNLTSIYRLNNSPGITIESDGVYLWASKTVVYNLQTGQMWINPNG